MLYCVHMTYETILPIYAFALVTTGTPGPNNFMLLASGMNFGFKRTIPHILGISCGMVLLTFGIGLGLGAIFEAFPIVRNVLKIIAILFLTYMAYKIATAPNKFEANETKLNEDTASNEDTVRPFKFIEAALFQWVNPKAWAMVISALATFAPNPLTTNGIAFVASGFFLVGMPTITLWVVAGKELRKFLNSPKQQKIFNFSCAGLLLATVIPILL